MSDTEQLDQQIQKFEGQKRWSDMIKTILTKSEAVQSKEEKVDLILRAAALYIEKSSNQAEAIKCYEMALGLDGENTHAISALKDMYEKRRDWEKLLKVLERECLILPDEVRASRYVEMAKMATEKLRKPELRSELWKKVRQQDPSNTEALTQLTKVYDETKDWPALAEVLQASLEHISETQELKNVLGKLGTVYSEKLNDEQSAVEVFQKLLTIDPDDRKAQEQIKKRYVASKDWDALENFFDLSGKHDELIRILEREAGVKESPVEELVDLNMRVGRLWQERMQKTDRAARAYEKALELNPSHSDAALKLLPLIRGGTDSKKILMVLEILIATTESTDKAEYTKEAGLLLETKMKQAPQAFEIYKQGVVHSKADPEIRSNALRMVQQTKSYDALIEAYKTSIAEGVDASLEIELRLELAGVQEQKGDAEGALAELTKVVDLEPEHRAVLDKLEAVYRQLGRHEDLLSIYERKIQLSDGDERKTLLYGQASLYRQELGKKDKSIEVYESILSEYGDGETKALEALDELLRETGRYEDVSRLIERQIDAGPSSDEVLANLKFKLAQLNEKHLGDRSKGMELYREVVTIAPEHEGAKQAMEQLLDDPELGEQAAQLLEPLYEMGGAWTSLVKALSVQAKHQQDPEAKQQLFMRVSQVQEAQLNDANSALASAIEALGILPDHQEALERSMRLAELSGQYETFANAMERLGNEATDANLSRQLLNQAAASYQYQLGNDDQAVTVFKKILEQHPTDLESVENLEAIFTRKNQFDDLSKVLAQKAALVDEPLKIQTLFRLAEVHETALKDSVGAVSVYKDIFEQDPTNKAALISLTKLYEQQGQWSELTDTIEKQMNLSESEEETHGLMFRIASIKQSNMNQTSSALELYKQVLVSDPTHLPSLEALHGLSSSPQHQRDALEILEEAYTQNNDISKLVEVLLLKVQHETSKEARIELYNRIAEYHEVALDQPEHAFEMIKNAFQEDPHQTILWEQMERLGHGTQQIKQVCETYELVANRNASENEADPTLSAQLSVRSAELREGVLQDIEGAILQYQNVLKYEPGNEQAEEALERLYQHSNKWELLAALLLARKDSERSDEDKKENLFKAASVYEEKLQQSQKSNEVYMEILSIDPEDHHALDQLIASHLRSEQWHELIKIYDQKANALHDPEEKKEVYVELGAVYERELKDIPKAIDTYQKILELDPEHLGALGRLDVLYQESGAHNDLLSVLERTADVSTDFDEVIAFRYRAGELQRKELNNPKRAVETFQSILAADPEHEPTVQALEHMLEQNAEPLAVAKILEGIYTNKNELQKLAHVLEIQSETLESNDDRIEVLHRLYEMYDLHLDQKEKSLHVVERALALSNQDERTLAALDRLAVELEKQKDVAILYEKEALKSKQEGQVYGVTSLGLKSSALYEVAEDYLAAIRVNQMIQDFDPGQTESLEALDRLYQATSNWEKLADVLSERLERTADADDMQLIQYRRAQLWEKQLSKPSDAITQYAEILNAFPEHQGSQQALFALFQEGKERAKVLEILEPILRLYGQWDTLFEMQRVVVDEIPNREDKVRLLQNMALLQEEEKRDHAHALQLHLETLLLSPLDEHSFSESKRLATMTGSWDEYTKGLSKVLTQHHDQETVLALGTQLAETHLLERDDTQKAAETYAFMLGVVGSHEPTLESLDKILSQEGAHEPLVDVLAQRATLAGNDNNKTLQAESLYRQGQLLHHDLKRLDDALNVYKKIVWNVDPSHKDAIRAIEAIYIAQADVKSLTDLYQKEQEAAGDEDAKAQVLTKMARLAGDQMGETEKAIKLWLSVLEIRGEDPEALSGLGKLYHAKKEWGALTSVLEREAMVSEDAHRKWVFADIARTQYNHLSDSEKALDAWERAYDCDPDDATPILGMAEIHRDTKNQEALSDALQRALDVGNLEPGVLESVALELGQVRDALGNREGAIIAYKQAIQIAPGNFGTMALLESLYEAQESWGELSEIRLHRVEHTDDVPSKIEGLLSVTDVWWKQHQPERGRDALGRVLALDPENKEAYAQLERLNIQSERWEELIELYINKVEQTEDNQERVATLQKVSAVHEKNLGDNNEAFNVMQVAWEQDYTVRSTAAEIERLAGVTGRWNELLAAANTAIKEVTDKETKIALCLSCARWYGQHLGHPEYAIRYYDEILKLDPSNIAAMQQMADLYRSTQQWNTMGQILSQIVQVSTKLNERADALVQLGELSEVQLNQPDQALSYYRQAHELDPQNIRAIASLEKMYRHRQDVEALIHILERKVEAQSDVQQKAKAKVQLALVLEETGNEPRAVTVYQSAITTDPRSLEALKGLERVYTKQGHWAELLPALEKQLDVVETDRERITLLSQIGTIWEEQFVKHEPAATAFEKVLVLDSVDTNAMSALERLYRHMRKWPELIDTYERHVSATPDRQQKCDLYVNKGEVLEVELKDLPQATDEYNNALAIMPRDVGALNALARIYEAQGDHAQAVNILGDLSKNVSDLETLVGIRYRMGQIYDTQLGDRSYALECYQQVLDIQPGHLPTLEASRKILLESGDWLGAAKILEQEVDAQTTPRTKAKAYAELGHVYDQRLEETRKAKQAYEAAMGLDSDNEEAAIPLSNIYIQSKDYALALPLLDMLVKRMGKRPEEEQHQLAYTLGDVALQVNDNETATKALSKATQLNAQHLPTLLLTSKAYYQSKQWDKAFTHYQMILVHHRDHLSKEDLTDVFYRLGVIKQEQGDKRKAINMFEKALEETSFHEPTLRAMIEVHEQDGSFDQVLQAEKVLLTGLNSTEEKVALLHTMGEQWSEKMKNPAKAVESFKEALELDPNNHRILHKVLKLYQDTNQWPETIETIERIAALDERAVAKSKYYYTIGAILRDKMQDTEAALNKFNEALDHDPTNLKAFESIDKMVTQKKDWKQLERAYRKMLHRVSGKGDDALEFNLWHALGVIYRDRMKNGENAVEAFKIASSKQPDNIQEHQILAELYAVIGRQEEAVAEQQWILANDPLRVEPYQALYRLYFDLRAYDKAWCIASTLTFMKQADAEQAQFFEQYKPRGPIQARGRLTNELWMKHVFSREEDLLTSKIFEVMWPSVLGLQGQSDSQAGLATKYEIDFTKRTTVTIAQTFQFISELYGIATPRLFVRSDVQGGLIHRQVSPLASLCGSGLLSGLQPQELMFLVGHHLSDYRGEHYIRTLLESNTQLKQLLLTGLRLGNVVPSDPALDQLAEKIGARMVPAQLDALRSIGKRFVDAGAVTDVKKWLGAVELGACRAGFIACGDLDIAKRAIASKQALAVDLPPQDKIKDLIVYSVSEDYFTVREALGITIKI